MKLEVQPLTSSFGAQVMGLSLAAEHDEDAIETLKSLWRKHKLLLFRDQSMDEAALVRFSRRFGKLEIHVRKEYLSAEHPEVLLVSNIERNGRPLGILEDREVGWHYDQIYLERPAVGSLLHAVHVPPAGGNTQFADMGAAYAALPAETAALLEGKLAVQSYEHFNRAFSVPTTDEQKRRTPDREHPAVRSHPYTGEKALYICPGMTTRITGLAPERSEALLNELFEFCVQPAFVYEHRWRVGDALMWDNACTMHRRERFDGRHRRLMKRTTILPDTEHAVPR
ncbi:MAG: TauD/TfdA dioxygenase family protein [Gammaproteobacteria bacterium]